MLLLLMVVVVVVKVVMVVAKLFSDNCNQKGEWENIYNKKTGEKTMERILLFSLKGCLCGSAVRIDPLL